jgi:hypothetical protein
MQQRQKQKSASLDPDLCSVVVMVMIYLDVRLSPGPGPGTPAVDLHLAPRPERSCFPTPISRFELNWETHHIDIRLHRSFCVYTTVFSLNQSKQCLPHFHNNSTLSQSNWGIKSTPPCRGRRSSSPYSRTFSCPSSSFSMFYLYFSLLYYTWEATHWQRACYR